MAPIHILGLDANDKQLSFAKHILNVEYLQADAHATGLPDSCADLLTVAQALHWFDLPRFYQEAARVLKPSGALAAWTYDMCSLKGCDAAAAASSLLRAFYSGSGEGQMGPYWSQRRALVDARYAGGSVLLPPAAAVLSCLI